jgi:hypothetical protein
MHPSHNKAHLEGLWTEIETLQWVLGQIVTIKKKLEGNKGYFDIA